MKEKLYEFVKSKGHFYGDIMGADTYIVFIDSFVDELLKLFEKQNMKIKYFLKLYYKSNGAFIREIPMKNEYEAERQMAFYNSSINIKVEMVSVEVEK